MVGLPFLRSAPPCVAPGKLPAVSGQRLLGATLPAREQFVPCSVDPHRCPPHQDRPCFARLIRFLRGGQWRVRGLGHRVLQSPTRTRNGDRVYSRYLIASVLARGGLHCLPCCVPALLPDVPW